MSGVRLFMFLVALPALIVLGHDAWLFYQNQSQGFMLSAAGFLWTRYDPDSFKMVKDMVDPATWETINMVLEQKALFVAIAFAVFFYVILALLQILRVWPFNASRSRAFSSNTRINELLDRGNKKRR